MKRAWFAVALAGLISGEALADKSGDDGVPVTIVVVDDAGKAIPTAVVRHPDEQDRHRVNALNGEWTGSVLYLPDGTEMVFTPGMSITLEVSAPGYMTKIVNYDIRKRKNRVQVALPVLVVDESGIEEPIITFGRDKPIDNQ